MIAMTMRASCSSPRMLVRRWVSALSAIAVAASAHAQLGLQPLNSSTWPLSTPIFADAIEFVGLSVPPEVVWRCHGDYLERVHELESEAQGALDGLGLDGVRLERPDSLRKGITVLRRAIARRDEALAELMRCLADSVPENERTKVDQLGAELRARVALALGVTYGPPPEIGDGGYIFDVAIFLDELAITEGERAGVRAAVLSASSTRERTGRALLESGLANRMRLAELAVELGVAGMTSEEMTSALNELSRRQTAEAQAAWARGEKVEPPTSVWSQLSRLRSSSREAACDALRVQRDVIEAVAAVVAPEMGQRLRRAFRHRNMGLDSLVDNQRWEASQPGTPAVMWTARRVLSQPEVRGERRAEAVKTLSAWADAEDVVKERMARERLQRLCDTTVDLESHAPRGPGSFYPGAPPISELVEAARPFQERLAKLLDMPWIADASVKPPALPAPEALPEFSRAETALTGALHRAAMPANLRVYEPRKRGVLGWRPVDAQDVDEWMTMIGDDGATREVVEALVDAHRAAWDERVAPLMAVALERRPPAKRVELEGGGFAYTDPPGIREWRARVHHATETSLPLATEIDAALFSDLRAAVGPDRAWCVDAIVFHRQADRMHSVSRWIASVPMDAFLFRSVRVDPVAAILRAGLTPEQARSAIHATVAELPSLSALLEEESQLLMRLRLEDFRPTIPGEQEAIEDHALANVNRIMGLEASWRALERGALDAAMQSLDAANRNRLERAVHRARFPHALSAVDTVTSVSEELRRGAAEDDDVERGLRAIEAIDAAEASFTECAERRAGPFIEKMQRPIPVKFDSLGAARTAREESTKVMTTAGGLTSGESARFAWYLANALPPEIIWRSPAFLRMAGLYRVTPPRRREQVGDVP